MATTALPADLFDFEEWMGKPPLAQASIVMDNRKQWNLVFRRNTVEDNEWTMQWFKDNPDAKPDSDDVVMARCLVQITRGGAVELEQVDVPAESPLDPEGMRRLRIGAAEKQWAAVQMAMQLASYMRPEPEAPSSPKS